MQTLLTLKKQVEVFCKPKIFKCLEKWGCLEPKLLHNICSFTHTLFFWNLQLFPIFNALALACLKIVLQVLDSKSHLILKGIGVGDTEEICTGKHTKLSPNQPFLLCKSLHVLGQTSFACVKVKVFSLSSSSTFQGLRHFCLLQVPGL